MKLDKKYKGTYLEKLINAYNEFEEHPKYYGKEAYEYMRSLRIEIAQVRKQVNNELKNKKANNGI